MAKIEDGELNKTQGRIMDYLRSELASGPKFVSYTVIALKVERSRNTVKYNVNRLIRMGMLDFIDGELSLP
jgi:predicted transcriptional regulator